jgi:heme oxygenase
MMLRMVEGPATIPSSLRVKLRISTASAHARLDGLAAAFPLSTRDGYADFLAAHAAALIPIEQALAEADVNALLPDWPSRCRSGAVMRDLDILRAELRAIAVPPICGEAAIFGTLYVLEGSRLGARVILQNLDPRIAGAATHYLQHGDTRLWPTFLSALEASNEAHEDFSATLDAALCTFEVFERAFQSACEVAA